MSLPGAARIRRLYRDGEWKLERRSVRAATDLYDYGGKLRCRSILRAQAAGRKNEQRHRERSSSPSHGIHPSI
jgi:hypothetical protein